MSVETVRAYEQGKRRPTRETLVAIAGALHLERRHLNVILQSAGFASAGVFWGPPNPYLEFTLDEATAYVEEFDWPSTVMNEFMEVAAANRTAQRLWGVNLRDRKDPAERNLLGVISRPPFCDRVINWDEAVGVAIAVMKGHYRGPETQPQGSSAYFSHIMQYFLQGEPKYVRRFLDLWDKTPPVPHAKRRWSYRVVWDEPNAGIMTFRVFSSTCSDLEALQFQDWIPVDAASWEALSRVIAGG